MAWTSSAVPPSPTDVASPPAASVRTPRVAGTPADRSEVVAILAPTGRDGALAATVLERGGITAISCADVTELWLVLLSSTDTRVQPCAKASTVS